MPTPPEDSLPALFLLGAIAFSAGLALQPRTGAGHEHRAHRLLLSASLVQWLLLPLLAAGWIALVEPPPGVRLALWLVAACPGGYGLLSFALLARSDLRLATSLSVTSTLLKPLLTPWIWALGGAALLIPASGAASRGDLAQPLLWTLPALLLPLAAGAGLRRHLGATALHRWQSWTQAGMAALLVLAVAVAIHRYSWPRVEGWEKLALLVVAHHASACLLGAIIAILLGADRNQRHTLTLAAGTFNAGVAAPLALLLFGNDALALITLGFWTLWRLVAGLTLSLIWRQGSLTPAASDVAPALSPLRLNPSPTPSIHA